MDKKIGESVHLTLRLSTFKFDTDYFMDLSRS